MYRYLAIFLALAVVLIIGGAARNALYPQVDPNGRDTFGTRYYGWRGFFETLEKLHLPVARSQLPPSLVLSDYRRTLIFWESSKPATEREPEYLARVREWIEAGGEAVIALPRYSVGERLIRGNHQDMLLDILVDNAVGLMIIDTAWQEKDFKNYWLRKDETRRTFSEDVGNYEQAMIELRDPQTYRLRGTGDFSWVAKTVDTITLPRVLQNLRIHRRPQAMLTVLLGNRRWALAAKYSVGRGAVTVVAEPSLIYNFYLANSGNAALAARLLFSSPEKTAIFDEFYHGHRATKKTYQLFSRSPYAEIFGASVLLFGVIIWRAASRFGPPIPLLPPTRRTILEHIGALARWLQRGRTQNYLARENFTGILWELRRHWHLTSRSENAETLTRIVDSRAPQASEDFAIAVRRCEDVLAKNERREPRLLAALADLNSAATQAKITGKH